MFQVITTTGRHVADVSGYHETREPVRCTRCKRPLRAAASIAAKIGGRCAAIEAAFDGLKAEQQAKALELIADGGIVASAHAGVWLVSSSTGDAVYRTSVKGNCTCAHGLRTMTAKPCWHAGAVKLVAKPRRSSLAMAA